MLVSTKAVVISKLKYNDNDLIVKCLTRDFGVKSYLIKNVLRSKTKRQNIAYFQLFSILAIEADHKEGRALHYIKEVKRQVNLTTIYEDVIKSSITMFLCEVLSRTINEEEKDVELYEFIENKIIQLDKNTKNSIFHLTFLIELTRFLGFYPNLENSNLNYFNLLEGNFQLTETNAYCVSGETLTLFKTLLGTNFDVTKFPNMTLKNKRELLNMILLYFRLHLHGFKEPKSLSVLNQVFS